ncbi:MAG TPA: acyltransferase [Rhizomicrobium sp.]|nr:acyltransferase [Rhizomicrobium sp.]
MKRLYSLDSLRGLAALAIVVWHWQHFFAVRGVYPDRWSRSAQPYYAVLKPLYEGGWMAVDLFFALSGFIFFWLYASAIRERAMGAGKFAWLRFSRLYPLHLATLLAVAVLQYFFRKATGVYFIYRANDLQHFASGLLLAQQWLPPTLEQTFNGPAWSVSIEALLYVIFFGFCRAGFQGPRFALLIALCGIPLLIWNEFIARGVMGFFLGGVAFHVTNFIAARPGAKRLARAVCALSISLWVLVGIECYLGPLHDAAGWLFRHFPPDVGPVYFGDGRDLFLLLFIFIVSPVTIMALALHERVLGGRWRRLSILGDISYSTYMLHFPMQLVLAVIAVHFALTPAAFDSPLVLALFYLALIGLGLLSFNFFERPLQGWLRGIPRRKRSLAASGRPG